jgi:hypothetical protein
MARLRTIEEILFPVEETRLFVFPGSGGRPVKVPGKKAVVHGYTGRVLGIAGREYRLVTNFEALEWAYQCCQTVFPETRREEWSVKAADAPSTGGHCFIDLVHHSTHLDFRFVPAGDRPDAFGPFIRVTNSYNGLRALSFDIGFLRKVCSNGLILPESVISFKFNHLNEDIRSAVEFHSDPKRLSKLKTRFNAYLGVLRETRVPARAFEPLLHAVLQLRPPEYKDKSRENPMTAHWERLCSDTAARCNRYAKELGETAYAVLNVVTDFASHPPDNPCIRRERHSFQRLAGLWMTEFTKECRQPRFSIARYVQRRAALAKTRHSAAHGGTPRHWSHETINSHHGQTMGGQG